VFSGGGVFSAPFGSVTEGVYEVAELTLPLYTEELLYVPPRGEEEAEEVAFAAVGRDEYWESYHDPSTEPREWTCDIDGSSSFAFVKRFGT
jgi:hypothetical protein